MQSLEDWKAARLAALTAEDGWVNLTDRVEIAPGPQRVGRGPGNDLVLSVGPDHLGVLTLSETNLSRSKYQLKNWLMESRRKPLKNCLNKNNCKQRLMLLPLMSCALFRGTTISPVNGRFPSTKKLGKPATFNPSFPKNMGGLVKASSMRPLCAKSWPGAVPVSIPPSWLMASPSHRFLLPDPISKRKLGYPN